jgi:hypothetical protein
MSEWISMKKSIWEFVLLSEFCSRPSPPVSAQVWTLVLGIEWPEFLFRFCRRVLFSPALFLQFFVFPFFLVSYDLMVTKSTHSQIKFFIPSSRSWFSPLRARAVFPHSFSFWRQDLEHTANLWSAHQGALPDPVFGSSQRPVLPVASHPTFKGASPVRFGRHTGTRSSSFFNGSWFLADCLLLRDFAARELPLPRSFSALLRFIDRIRFARRVRGFLVPLSTASRFRLCSR